VARRSIAALATAAVSLLIAATASTAAAATWFAAPAGHGSAPCVQSDPCDIYDAVAGAPTGNKVAALAGTYEITTELHVQGAILLQGPYSGPAAVFEGDGTSGPAIEVTGSGTRVTDLAIRQTSLGTGIEIGAGGAGDRLDSATEGAGVACAPVVGGSFRDSVCASYGGGNGVAADEDTAVAGSAELTNVTAISNGDGANAAALLLRASNGAELEVEAANVIAYSMGDAPDIASGALAGSTGDLILERSNYDTAAALAPGTVTDPGTNGNQTDEPRFADAAERDYSEAAGSPTIDAGGVAVSLGLLDVVRRARNRGGGPDIGAFEYVPPPDTRAPNVSIPVAPKGRIRTKRRHLDLTFELAADEPNVRFECKIDRLPTQTCSSPVTFRLEATKGVGTTYTLTVRATDAAGNRSGKAIRQVRLIRKKRR
jgi:hypothetical protein